MIPTNILYGKPALTNAQRNTLTDKAIELCIDRNLVMDVMAKCIVARSYRELWVLVPDLPPRRLI